MQEDKSNASGLEKDKVNLRKIFDQFDAMSKTEFNTETGKEIGNGIAEAVKIIKPYIITLSQRLK